MITSKANLANFPFGYCVNHASEYVCVGGGGGRDGSSFPRDKVSHFTILFYVILGTKCTFLRIYEVSYMIASIILQIQPLAIV